MTAIGVGAMNGLEAIRSAPCFGDSDDTGIDVVTGAFSYSGSAIASQLQGKGRNIITLTNHPDRASETKSLDAKAVTVAPLDFDDPAALAKAMEGATTLFNTYWVRFAHGGIDHSLAVDNSRTLFVAAKRAGIRKVVHVSILNPSSQSPYPYFRGKAMVERALAENGMPYTVLRPSVLFDEKGVLLNNIAYLLRKLPVFGVGGDGNYGIRPTHVADLASMALEASDRDTCEVFDAVGPDRFTFMELVKVIRHAVGSKSVIVKVPPKILLGLSAVLGTITRDVLLTREEYYSMAEGLADSAAPATGNVSLTEWLDEYGSSLGRDYRNELDLHFR